jgi:hypothetical protein
MNRAFQKSLRSFQARKVGDSNPRYGNPHGSLANCWFQPLTQPSLALLSFSAPVSKCDAKVAQLFVTAKHSAIFFSIDND